MPVKLLFGILLVCIFFTTAQSKVLRYVPNTDCTNEGYTNCEKCKGPTGTGVPWGAIQSVSFPMAILPDLIMPCGPIPGCTMEVFFKKRMCGDTIQMKVCGFKFTGCTANACRCKITLNASPVAAFLWYAAGPPFKNNSFNLFNNVPFDWTNVDILSYTCYGIYDDNNSCSPLYIIPCKEYACCKYTLRVKSDPDCGTIGFVAAWNDVSTDPAQSFTDPECAVCKSKTNHRPSKPYPDGNPNEEFEQIALAMGFYIGPGDYYFKNENANDNKCIFSCPDLRTLDKVWYVSDDRIIPVNINRKQKRRK